MPPCSIEQGILADDLTGLLQQDHQYRISLGFDGNRLTRPLQAMGSRFDDDVVALVDPAAVGMGLGHDLA